MNTYWVYYSCPSCKTPCGEEPNANEGISANSKAEARALFNTYKPCRHMKITRIVKA